MYNPKVEISIQNYTTFTAAISAEDRYVLHLSFRVIYLQVVIVGEQDYL